MQIATEEEAEIPTPVRAKLTEMLAPISPPQAPIMDYLKRSSPLTDSWVIIAVNEGEFNMRERHGNKRKGSNVTNCLRFSLLWLTNQCKILETRRYLSGKITEQNTPAQHHSTGERGKSTIASQRSSTSRTKHNSTLTLQHFTGANKAKVEKDIMVCETTKIIEAYRNKYVLPTACRRVWEYPISSSIALDT